MQRVAKPPLNLWRVSIVIAGCIMLSTFQQDPDEDLNTVMLDPSPPFFGSCQGFQPLENLKAETFATEADAKAVYTEAIDWVWPAY